MSKVWNVGKSNRNNTVTDYQLPANELDWYSDNIPEMSFGRRVSDSYYTANAFYRRLNSNGCEILY